jgi:hypothetical protein
MTWSSLGMRELKSTESSSSSFDVSASPESCFSAWRSLEITRSSSGATASAPKKWVHSAEGSPSACPSTTVCEKTRLGKSSGGPSKRPSPDTFAVVGLRDLRQAKLKGAVLEGADLEGVNLSNADLRSADLTVAELSGARLCGAMLAGARGGRAATVQVQPADGKALTDALKVGSPVVVALTAAGALRLRSVAVVNYNDDRSQPGYGRYNAKRMEVLTGPAADGPWTSVATFTSAKTKDLQTFAAAPDAPALGGFVQVLVHDTHGDQAFVQEVSLEGEAWGPAA